MQKRLLKVSMMLALAVLCPAPTFASNAYDAVANAEITQQTGNARGFVKDTTG